MTDGACVDVWVGTITRKQMAPPHVDTKFVATVYECREASPGMAVDLSTVSLNVTTRGL